MTQRTLFDTPARRNGDRPAPPSRRDLERQAHRLRLRYKSRHGEDAAEIVDFAETVLALLDAERAWIASQRSPWGAECQREECRRTREKLRAAEAAISGMRGLLALGGVLCACGIVYAAMMLAGILS